MLLMPNAPWEEVEMEPFPPQEILAVPESSIHDDCSELTLRPFAEGHSFSIWATPTWPHLERAEAHPSSCPTWKARASRCPAYAVRRRATDLSLDSRHRVFMGGMTAGRGLAAHSGSQEGGPHLQ